MTSDVDREAMSTLATSIEDQAFARRAKIKEEVTRQSVSDEKRVEYRERIEDIIPKKMDQIIVGDAGYLNKQGVVGRMITTDKNHIYSNREELESKLRLSVNYVKDEVADPTSPTW